MLLIITSILAVAAASPHAIDPAILRQIFTPKLEDITVRPTQFVSRFLDGDGEECQCVPYYHCDPQMNAIDLEDPTVSGFGKLDIRLGSSSPCQETTEHCCKLPKIKTELKPLKPDASRLKGCGYRNVKGLDFTVTGGNGNEAQFGEFPWVVAIMDADNDAYLGVGVLIHPQVVMTGAHIINGLNPKSLKIRAGEWDTQTEKERLPYQELMVDTFKMRADFGISNLFNDIAILRLEKPVELADHINVACLPEQDESFDRSTKCIANGWGKEKYGRTGKYAVILKKVELSMVPHHICNLKLRSTRLGHYFRLHQSFVCAVGDQGQDTCQGDGGAPLVCPVGDSTENRYKVSGLAAWGIGCGKPGLPGIYTRVSMFRSWVDSIMTSWQLDTSSYTM